jgi:hypothetical protein
MMQLPIAEELVAQRRAHDLAVAARYGSVHRSRPAAQRHHFHLMSVAAVLTRLPRSAVARAESVDGTVCVACA